MRKILVLIAVLTLSIASIAQTRVITGKVTDEKGDPVAYASVKIKNTTRGVSADQDGNFRIEAEGRTTLVISAANFAEKEVVVEAGESVANVILLPGRPSLEEVIVTAIGIRRAEKSLGYATAKINGEELLKARDPNLVSALSGKVSGVRVTGQSGTLGGSSRIIIRGTSSFDGDNQPIFVVDGMPIFNTFYIGSTGGTSTGGTSVRNNVDFGNRAGDINPDDIETITVLKGASATALYGARAKNGAIVITTKKGKKGTSSIDVNSSVRMETPLKLPDFQNEYAQGTYGVYDLKFTNGWGPKISEVQDLKFPDFKGDQVTLQAYSDNIKDFFDRGISFDNSVSFAGGGDNSDYRLSVSSLNQTGIIPGAKLNRYTITFNGGREFNNKLSSRFSASYIKTKGIGRSSQASNNTNIITSSLYNIPRTVNMDDLRNNFEDPITGAQIFLSTDKSGNNPFWITKYNKNGNDLDRIVGNFTLTYKPLKWLTLSNTLGADVSTETRFYQVRKGTAGYLDGEFTNTDIFARQINNDFLVTMEKTVSDFDFKLIVGHNINDREIRGSNVLATGITIDQLYTYSNAASKDPTNQYSRQRLIGVFGDLGISYKNMLFMNLTGRNDWSSTLPIASRSYFYPSISSSFIFTELDAVKDHLPWLNYGKLRASWASVGSDALPYQTLFQYTPVTTVFIQYVSANATIFPFAPINTAFSGPRIYPNATLVPQRQNSYEIGTDLRFLNSRISLGFTYYNTYTKDQLLSIVVPASTGYFSRYVNAGAIRNKGIEVDLNGTIVKTRDLTWEVGVNFAHNKQVVEELSGSIQEYTLPSGSGYSGLTVKATKGGEFGIYGSVWSRDPDGNFIIDGTSGLRKTVTDKRIGNVFPDWTGGINTNLRYKGFGLSGLVDIRKGGVIFSGTVANLRSSGLAEETLPNRGKTFIDKGVVLDPATNKYIPNTVPVQSMQDFWQTLYGATTNTEGSVFDGSFAKLREVRLSYALPSSLLGKGIIKSCEVALEGRNLWIIKSYVPHIDPEQNFFGATGVAEGVEFNSVPTARSFGVNVRLGL